MADDYAQLQARITDEIADTSLTSQIQYKIQDAIKFYSREKWPFLEGTTTFSTVAGTQAYSLPSDYKSMRKRPRALISGSNWPLKERTFDYLNDITVVPTVMAPPQDYAIFASQIWLYPIPDAVYTVTEYYDKFLTPLSAGGDANIWTQDGEELIRVKAMQLLYRHVIKDDAQADALQADIDTRIYPNFRSGYNSWNASGVIMPTYL